MRLWSFHPMYLDKIGYARVINEAVAGYHAYMKTGKGYPAAWEKHSQLARFKAHPSDFLRDYIKFLIDYKRYIQLKEIDFPGSFLPDLNSCMTVTEGQLDYEWKRYLSKLKIRNFVKYSELKYIQPKPHPLFTVIKGDVEHWEKISVVK